MAMEDLFKGLTMFHDGMSQLAVNTGIQQATQQVDEINNSMTDEMQKRKAQDQLAKQLTLQLTQAGANNAQIATAVGAVAPKPITSSADAYTEAVTNNDPSMMKMAKDMQTFEKKPGMDLQGLKNAGDANVANINGEYKVKEAEVRLTTDQKKQVLGITNKFNGAIKDQLEQYNKTDDMAKLLDSKNNISDTALRNQFARVIGGEKGRIPVQELMQYSGDSDWASSFSRLAARNFEGYKFTDKDREQIKTLVQNARASKAKVLRDTIDQHAGQATGSGLFTSQDEAAQRLIGGNKTLQNLLDTRPQDKVANTPPAAPPVRMIDPQGKVRLVPADKVEAAKASGGKPAPVASAQGSW